MSFDVAGSIADSLPALLLVHGDSYSWGAGNSFDGTALAAHGRLIVVSINFRLGVLGKLAIPTCIFAPSRSHAQTIQRFSSQPFAVICDRSRPSATARDKLISEEVPLNSLLLSTAAGDARIHVVSCSSFFFLYHFMTTTIGI